jgi:hypothetical protein
MTKKIAALAMIIATVILQRCCRRLSLLFAKNPNPIPIRRIPKTTNIKVNVNWERTTGVPACNAINKSVNT